MEQKRRGSGRRTAGTDVDVFVSYSRDDLDAVSRLVSALRDLGLEVWIDRDSMEAGDAWAESIEQALHRARAIVLVVGSQAGNWQRAEWTHALEATYRDKRKRVIPVRLGAAELPPFLSRWQSIQAGQDADSLAAAATQIADLVRRNASRPPAPPSRADRAMQEERLALIERGALALKSLETSVPGRKHR